MKENKNLYTSIVNLLQHVKSEKLIQILICSMHEFQNTTLRNTNCTIIYIITYEFIKRGGGVIFKVFNSAPIKKNNNKNPLQL